MQCIGYGPVPCPPFSCCDAWWTLTVNAVSPWHTSVLIHASIEVRPSPMAPAFHSPCSSALAFCCEVVYVHSDSSVVWASTGFLSVSIAWLPKGCYEIGCGLSLSPGCVLQLAECALSHRATWGHLDAPAPPVPPPQVGASPLLRWALRVHVNGNGSSLPRFHIWWLTNLQNLCCLVPYFSFIINLSLSYEKIRLGFVVFFFLTKCVSVIKLFCGEDNLTRFYFITRDPSYWLYLS